MTNAKVHTFTASKNVGNMGEALMKEILKKSKVGKYIYVAENPQYQKLGIDFLIRKNNIGIDSKFDTQTGTTGNIALETVSRMKDGEIIKHGWAYTSKAHLISYIYMDLHAREWVMFLFTTEKARELINEYKDKPNAVKTANNYSYNSEIVRVPVVDIQNLFNARFPILSAAPTRETKKVKEFILGMS